MKRRSVATFTRSAPVTIVRTCPRSSPAISSSDVLRTANSKPKFGALEICARCLANNCIQRAGRCKNAMGLINTAVS
ncbi:Uncharacterised protein [Mycobacterium tuberculosis]|nr:Uncharacterised protein [Mycobacterium tuberculosis]